MRPQLLLVVDAEPPSKCALDRRSWRAHDRPTEGQHQSAVADRPVAEDKAVRVKVYAYGENEQALADLTTGGCDAFMKLAPVTAWARPRSVEAQVVEAGITREVLGICVRRGDDALRGAINVSAGAP